MPREYARCLGVALATWLPLAVALAAARAAGLLSGKSALAAGVATLILAMLVAIPFAASLAAARRAIERLGERDEPITAASLPFVARALGPGLMRLRSAYGTRLIHAETRLAAAEAIIAAIPDPLLLIDTRRRIVRANVAAAELIGRRAEPGDLAGALRSPVLLSAVDALLRPGPHGETGKGPGKDPRGPGQESNSACRDQPIGSCAPTSHGSTGRGSTARSRF